MIKLAALSAIRDLELDRTLWAGMGKLGHE
jgi:hypothetical protein